MCCGRGPSEAHLRGEGRVVPGKEIRELLSKQRQTDQADTGAQRPKRRRASLLSCGLMAVLHPELWESGNQESMHG